MMLPSPIVPSSLLFQLPPNPRSALYFSVSDACRRPEVLRSVGFTVHECTVLSEMVSCLRAGENPDLVCVADCWEEPAESVLTLVRSLTGAPMVLFSSGRHLYAQGAWDLEVPAMTHPRVWLSRIVQMMEHPDGA